MKICGSFVSVAFVILLLFQNTNSETRELDGVWEGTLYGGVYGVSYIFTFKSDSFFIALQACNDVPVECHNSNPNCSNEFVAGTFTTTPDSLLLRGHCADSTFIINTNTTGCRNGPTAVCDFALNKRYRLVGDTVFLYECPDDCPGWIIRKTSGTIRTQNDDNTELHSSEINLQVNNSGLFLKLPPGHPLYNLKIVNTLGRVVYREPFISGDKSLGVFSLGIYLLSAKTFDGRTVNLKFQSSF
jgi:hypothetical protein